MKPSARNAFVEAEVVTAIAHQIRVLRQQRGWSQIDLAKRMATTQTAVSRLEDPSYGRVSVATLLQLGRVFDVGLQVKFVSLVRMLKDTWSVSRQDLEVESFEEESKRVAFVVGRSIGNYVVPSFIFDTGGNVSNAKMLEGGTPNAYMSVTTVSEQPRHDRYVLTRA